MDIELQEPLQPLRSPEPQVLPVVEVALDDLEGSGGVAPGLRLVGGLQQGQQVEIRAGPRAVGPAPVRTDLSWLAASS